MRIKITDGDMVIITVTEDFNAELVDITTNKLKGWLKSKQLNNVDMLLVIGKSFNIHVMSVNDVFEGTVLDEKS